MSYAQIATPNLTQDLTVDGRSDWLGMCLAVAEVAGGTQRLYGYAWQAWENAVYKHADRNLPEGCWVPAYYFGYWNGVAYGHIVWGKRSGGSVEIWSSPYTHKPYFDIFSGELNATIDKVCSIYGMSYFAGWAEDLAGKRFVGEAEATLAAHQRQVGSVPVNYRRAPSVSGELIDTLDAGAICDFKGYVKGQEANGTDIWYVGAYTGGYANAAGFTLQTTEGLSLLTYETSKEEPLRDGLDFVDVSAWQGDSIDWAKVKAVGCAGAVIRAGHVGASYGGIQPHNLDPYHDRWAREARAAGLLVGHYWYCYESLDASAEAHAFMSADIQDGEPIFIDAEEKDLSESWVNVFTGAILEKLRATAIYYDYTANLKAKTWVEGAVWQAHYGAGQDRYEQVRDIHVIMHQYTSEGSVEGIKGNVDLNRFYGTEEDWRNLGNWTINDAPTQVPEPEQTPELEPEPEPDTGLDLGNTEGVETLPTETKEGILAKLLQFILELIKKMFSSKE